MPHMHRDVTVRRARRLSRLCRLFRPFGLRPPPSTRTLPPVPAVQTRSAASTARVGRRLLAIRHPYSPIGPSAGSRPYVLNARNLENSLCVGSVEVRGAGAEQPELRGSGRRAARPARGCGWRRSTRRRRGPSRGSGRSSRARRRARPRPRTGAPRRRRRRRRGSRAIDSATVGVVRGLNAGLPSIRYATRNAERSASPSSRRRCGVGGVADDRVGEVGAADRLALGRPARRSRTRRARSRAPAARRPSPRRAARGPGARRAGDRGAPNRCGRRGSRARGGPAGRGRRRRSRRRGTTRTPSSEAASIACCTPSTVSWSLSASNSTPACAAAATTSCGSSAPSEWSEWLWRSKVGGSALKRREGSRSPGRAAARGLPLARAAPRRAGVNRRACRHMPGGCRAGSSGPPGGSPRGSSS